MVARAEELLRGRRRREKPVSGELLPYEIGGLARYAVGGGRLGPGRRIGRPEASQGRSTLVKRRAPSGDVRGDLPSPHRDPTVGDEKEEREHRPSDDPHRRPRARRSTTTTAITTASAEPAS